MIDAFDIIAFVVFAVLLAKAEQHVRELKAQLDAATRTLAQARARGNAAKASLRE